MISLEELAHSILNAGLLDLAIGLTVGVTSAAANCARALVANFLPKSFLASFLDNFLNGLDFGVEIFLSFLKEKISKAAIGFGISDIGSLSGLL